MACSSLLTIPKTIHWSWKHNMRTSEQSAHNHLNFLRFTFGSFFHLKKKNRVCHVLLDVSTCSEIVLLGAGVVFVYVRTVMNCLFFVPYDVYRMTSCIYIANCAHLQLEISGNGAHERSLIRIDNVPRRLYELWSPAAVRTLSMLLTLRYRRHFLAGGFRLLPNFIHKRIGNLQKKKNNKK